MIGGFPPQSQLPMDPSAQGKPTPKPLPDIRPLYGVEMPPPDDTKPPKPDFGDRFGKLKQMIQMLMQMFQSLFGQSSPIKSSDGGAGQGVNATTNSQQ